MHRCETDADAERRRIQVTSRYERRREGRIVDRADETVSYTWHTEDEMLSHLRATGFSSLRIEPPAWPRGDGRSYAVSARA